MAYQSDVRGLDTDDESCNRLVEFLEAAVQENQNISVVGEQLDLRTDCELSETFVVSCADDEDNGLNIAAIAGAAAGGGVILIIILIIIVVLLVLLGIIIKKRRDKKNDSQ